MADGPSRVPWDPLNFRRYLAAAGMAPTGVHVLRHTAAKLRRDAGESIETVGSFLDHSSLAVTSVYLRRLEGQEDRTWRVATRRGQPRPETDPSGRDEAQSRSDDGPSDPQ
jgi:integrase